MAALTDFITRIRLHVGDPRLSEATLTEGLRAALTEYTLARPLIRTYITEGSGSKTLYLPADFEALFITRLQLWNDDPDLYTEITFLARKVDEQWLIRTTQAYQETDVLIITYAIPHTIDGLDDAAGTTIPTADHDILCRGAAGFALRFSAGVITYG